MREETMFLMERLQREDAQNRPTLEMARKTPGYQCLAPRQKEIFEMSLSAERKRGNVFRGDEKILSLWGGGAIQFLESEGETIPLEEESVLVYKKCHSKWDYYDFLERREVPCILAFDLRQESLRSDRNRLFVPFLQGLYLGNSDEDWESGIVWGRQNRRENFSLEFAGSFYAQCECLMLPTGLPLDVGGGGRGIAEELKDFSLKDRATILQQQRKYIISLFAARPFRVPKEVRFT